MCGHSFIRGIITFSIGYAIAQRLGSEGAAVVISSRKEANVERAVKSLKNEGITVEGVVCHVSNAEHRKTLFEVVRFSPINLEYFYMLLQEVQKGRKGKNNQARGF